jgi:MFS family permease
MNASKQEELLQNHERSVSRNLRRNYLAHSVEGGLFMGGMVFVHTQTVLPTIIHALKGPLWLIAAAPIIMSVGYLTPQILLVNRIERSERMMPFVLKLGLFQRLSYLACAILLLLLPPTAGPIALVAIALTPLVSGIAGGLSMPAWMELVAKTIPERRLSSLWAVRLVITGSIGIWAGKSVTKILDAHPGIQGYGILHLIAFAFIAVSLFLVSTVRESNLPPKNTSKEPNSLLDILRSIVPLVRSDGRLARFLTMRFLGCGNMVLIPFLAIHALDTLKAPESFVGALTACQTGGMLAGNLVTGWMGDRFGAKRVILTGYGIFLCVCLWSIFAGTATEFKLIYVMVGLGMACEGVGAPALGLQICTVATRVRYIAIQNLALLPGFLLSAFAGWQIRAHGANFAWLAVLAAAMIGTAFYVLTGITEPRKNRLPTVVRDCTAESPARTPR